MKYVEKWKILSPNLAEEAVNDLTEVFQALERPYVMH